MPRTWEQADGPHVALVFGSLAGGGIERSMLRTAAEMAGRGLRVTIIVRELGGDLASEVPPEARLVVLERSPPWVGYALAVAADPWAASHFLASGIPKRIAYLPSLVRAFRTIQANAILSAAPPSNVMSVWARRLASSRARLAVSQRNQTSAAKHGADPGRGRYPPALLGHVYLQADTIIAVSNGTADDLAATAGIPRERIVTVYNPVVGPDLFVRTTEPSGHPWLAPDAPPVILGCGRLHPQKDFPTLIRAFARVRACRPARLLILGAPDPTRADYIAMLHRLPTELGIAEDVTFTGFVANPFAFMRRAALLVLSSIHEGLPNTLVEALACGCPVVSTDCPSGPAEILDQGVYGRLVPVGDSEAMAAAILATLDEPPDRERLRVRGGEFTAVRAVGAYLGLLFPGARAGPWPVEVSRHCRSQSPLRGL